MTVERNMSQVMFLLGTLETGGSEAKFVRLARRLTEEGRSIHVAYFGPPDTLLPKLDQGVLQTRTCMPLVFLRNDPEAIFQSI